MTGPEPQLASNDRAFTLLALALIAIAACIAYLPAFSGALLWNDDDYVTKPELRSVHGLARIWFDVGATQQYYPLLHSFFWIQSQLWGDHPLGFHLVNLALHLTAVGLLYLILRRLQVPGALLAAAIFALHPVMVETVAWITEQKNTLSTVFYLGAMLVYLHFDDTRKPVLYAAALALYLLAMASKTVTATLPAALLVILWWQRGELSWRRDVRPLIPWFVLGIAAGLFTAWVERKYIGAEGADFDLSFVQRCLIAGQVPWFYAGKLLWPANLIFIYPRWEMDPAACRQWLLPAATLALLIALWAVRRKCRGPLAACLLFIGTLFPVLGFLNVYWFVFSFAADHLQYLASLALIALVAAGLAQIDARLQPGARRIGGALCVGWLGILGTLTWQQAHMYRDNITLYKTTIARNPACWMAYNNLGVRLFVAGQPREAIQRYQQALQIRPNYAEPHNNLGNALKQLGQFPEALQHYQQAIQIRPAYAEAFFNLGNTLKQLGQLPSAIEQYQQAIQIRPGYAEARYNLANTLTKLGRASEAIDQYREAVAVKPDFADAHMNLGIALLDAGHPQEAIEQFQQVLRLKPDDAVCHAKLAVSYAQLHRSEEAVSTAQKAIELARTQEQIKLVGEIDAWLTNYRNSLSNQNRAPPSGEP